jgi:chromosome segregation ATPase
MSELLDSGTINLHSSRFIDEIVLLRQTRAENETLQALNTLYKSQVSDLEIEISDLKAQLTAKDHELKTLKERLHNRSQSCSDPRAKTCHSTVPEVANPAGLIREISYLKSLLETEKQQKREFEKQLNHVRASLDKSQELLNVQSKEKINKLQAIIMMLTEENENLKGEICCGLLEPSTAHKSLNSTEIKLSSIDTESASVADSTPRFEGSVQDIQESPAFECGFPDESTPKKFSNPEPPKTRILGDYPKKIGNLNRNVKYVNCNLSDILATPPKSKFTEFCPSYLRKFK